jgi:hypothetical protein
VWGVLTAFGAVVPIIGSGLVWIPATLLLLATQRYADAILLGVIGAIVVANVDNVARPLIYRRVSRIHPMITLVGAFAGIRYFGVLGVLFGPLGLAYFFEVLTLYRREYGRVAAATGGALGTTGVPVSAQPNELAEDRWKEGRGKDDAPVGEGQRHDAEDRRERRNVHGGELKPDDQRQRA